MPNVISGGGGGLFAPMLFPTAPINFGITDAVLPSPMKDVGPAFQSISFAPESGTGSLVSRVKLSALGGLS